MAASHSRGTKLPCWRAKVALLGQDKQRKLPVQIMYVLCLSCPSATFALQRGGFVPRKSLAAKGLLEVIRDEKILTNHKTPYCLQRIAQCCVMHT